MLPPSEAKIVLLASVGVSIANADRVVVTGISIESHTFVELHSSNIVRKGGGERLVGLLAHLPEKQEAMLVATLCSHPLDDFPQETDIFQVLEGGM